jgi:ATP-binding cassette subfamily B protein
MVTPSWARGYEDQARAGVWTVARAAPRTMALLVALAWRASARLTVLALVAQVAAAVSAALGFLATASVFTRLLAEGPTPHRLLAALPALALVAAAAIGRGLLQAGVGAVWAELTPLVELRAQDDLYSGLAQVELLAFDDPDFTQLVERTSSRAVMSIRIGISRVADLLTAAVSVLAAVVAVGVLSPVLAPLVVLAALPQAWASLRGALLELASLFRTVAGERRRDVTGELISERANAAEVRAFTAQRILLAEHRRISAELAEDAVRVGRRKNVLVTVGRALGALGALAGYLVLGLLLYTGGIALALAGTAVVAMRAAAQAVGNGVYSVNELYEIGIYVELYRGCLADIGSRRRQAPTHRLSGDPQVIELTDVSFRYPGQDRDAVTGISLSVRAGEVIALVGENGSGKSTLAKLITGLYLPVEGTVRWDGVGTDTVDPAELHERIAMVMQEPLRWPMSAENNIRIGRLERADPEGAAFAAAASRSGADAVLNDLPGGEQTLLSPAFHNGRDLSGGQWQRISVARGLYRDAAVVVADEPTSAMDARAEHAVFTALRALSTDPAGGRSRITVLITHRLANVRHADKIVVLEHGQVTEQGTHRQLIDRQGMYHQLFRLQAHAYRP